MARVHCCRHRLDGLGIRADAETLKTLYAFTGGADGAVPFSGLVSDVDGSLYGTTQAGGLFSTGQCDYGCGTVFKFDKHGTLTPLHAFSGGVGGRAPQTGVALFRNLLYGASPSVLGSPAIVYSVRPDGSAFTILHSLGVAEGTIPQGSLRPSGNYSIVPQTQAQTEAPVLVPRAYPSAVLGTSAGGGGVACAVTGIGSCGFIFAGRH